MALHLSLSALQGAFPAALPDHSLQCSQGTSAKGVRPLPPNTICIPQLFYNTSMHHLHTTSIIQFQEEAIVSNQEKQPREACLIGGEGLKV